MLRGNRCAIVFVALAACRLDTSGIGVPSNQLGTLDDGGSEDANADGTGTGTSATTDAIDGSAEGTAETTGTDPSGDATTVDPTTSGTTGAVDMCADDPLFTLAIPADQAIVVAPMQVDMLDNGTAYALSEASDIGTATFMFEVPCESQYRFHAFVYDGAPGEVDLTLSDNGADSYYVNVDGDAEKLWLYGCQTGGILVDEWQWQPVLDNAACIIGADPIAATLSAGMHTVSFRNREAGTSSAGDPGSAAALAFFVVTNDENWSP